MADVLKKLGDKAKEAVSSLKTLPPGDNEYQSLADTQAQVDAVSGKSKPAAPAKEQSTPAGVDKINPLARYGDRPGEKRINVEDMIKPLPSYDNGGDVPEDQVAVVHKDEKVLTPEEADQYRAEHEGAPTDFGGRVIPNPKGLKPILDTDIQRPSDTDRLPTGTKADIENAPLKTPEGDINNPPATHVLPDTEREANTAPKLSRLGGSLVTSTAKEKAEKAVQSPGAQTTTSEPTETQVQEQEVKEKSKPTLGQGLAQDWLKKIGATNLGDVTSKLTKPEELNTPTEAPATQSGFKPIAQPTTTVPTTPALTGKAAYEAKIKDYKQQYQTLLDRAAKENDPSLEEQAERVKLAMLEYQKAHPWGAPESAHPGVLGKIGHVAEQVASRAPGFAPIMATLPQSEVGRAEQTAETRGNLEKAAGETTAREAADAKSNPMPKLLGGEGNTAVAPDGTRYQRYEMPDHTARWAKEGEIPSMTSPANPPQGATQEGAAPVEAPKTIGDQPNIAQHPAVQASASQLPAGTVVGKPPEVKEGEKPATPAELADVDTRIKNNPYLTGDVAKQLSFPEGYKPTKDDVKQRLANIKEIEDAARQGKQDAALAELRKLQQENNNLLVKARLAEMADKQQQAQAKEAVNASVALAGLYAQENYKEKVDAWHNSGNFAKDSGLVTEIVDKEHSGNGAFSNVLGDALVGSMFGPEGSAIGAGVGAVTGLLSGPANGYLDTLKKQGISQEGYDVMQAYFNALPARMAYEISVQGVAASAMRSSQLIQKVLNTVPPPNTPEDSFDSAFKQYYKPMEVLTKGKVDLTAPKGYVAPKKEDFYPTTKKETKGPKGPNVPNEQNNKYHYAGPKGEIFSNDGTTWYDKQGKLVK